MAKIYRKDYRPYPFKVPTVGLSFNLDETRTMVKNQSHFVRKPGSEKEPLILHGEDIELLGLQIDGVDLARWRYSINEGVLRIDQVPDDFSLTVVTACNPTKNKTGSGLGFVEGEFSTQCESEGFRRMTYAPDRPDVLSLYSTAITADQKRYPVLLSNPDMVSAWDREDGTHHTVLWHDPIPKPSYLFALVAGDLAHVETTFVTSPSKRNVTVRVYAKREYIDSGQCDHALSAITKSMRWDEEHYGREYDRDLFMVYVSQTFNMGAMENSGLNVFNMKYVLALLETATDADFEGIEAVIAHEYFHNWSGNRVTVRDWFQLSLKEGFTVFRDQSFSETFRGLPEFIENVRGIRGHQFAEDAGPLAHPIRRDEMDSIDNNYTGTVYNKGATVIRMMHTLLGVEGFRKGTDLYFERHDGQACECEDFVKAMEDANGVDLSQFRHWYSYAGTPVVSLHGVYDRDNRTYYLTVEQSCPPTPGQAEKPAFHIPFMLGFVGANGDMDATCDSSAYNPATGVLSITKPYETFVFRGVNDAPALSLNRRFAPVKVDYAYRVGELETLASRDPNPFGRWDAWNTLAQKTLLDRIEGGNEDPVEKLAPVVASTLSDDSLPLDLKQAMLVLPDEEELANDLKEVDPVAIYEVRYDVVTALADRFFQEFSALYEGNRTGNGEVLRDADSIAKRALANTALGYLASQSGLAGAKQTVWVQFLYARGMTDKLAAFALLVRNRHRVAWSKLADMAITDFYDEYKQYPNTVDKWFAVQASNPHKDTLATVKQLIGHPAFDITVPNRVRSLIGSFAMGNPTQFHDLSGDGYSFLADFVLKLDPMNPQVAARIVEPLISWKRYGKARQELMLDQLRRLSKEKLSADTGDKVARALANA